jgi:hypothetical protein
MPNKTGSKRVRPSADIPAMPGEAAGSTGPESSAHPQESITVPLPVPEAAAVDYGVLDSLRAGQASVAEATQKFVQKLGEYLSAALDDATSLEVRTYISEDISGVTYEKGAFGGNARLRAMTRVNIDGDSLVCIPETDGELDTAVWTIHLDMVRQAQESRSELMRTMVSAAANLANVFTPKA